MTAKQPTGHTIYYEPEADILSIELNKKEISHAKEVGNVVVHFSQENLPVYLEFLEASKFFDRIHKLLRVKGSENVPAFAS